MYPQLFNIDASNGIWQNEIIDQLRAEALPNMGDPNVKAPNMLRLANEGVTLTRTYAVNPLCTPARATMMSGMYPHTHGAFDLVMYDGYESDFKKR